MKTKSYELATAVEVMSHYVVRVTFRDGSIREINLQPDLNGPVFEPLREASFFSRVTVDPKWGVLVWPNGADLSPEYTYNAGRVIDRAHPIG